MNYDTDQTCPRCGSKDITAKVSQEANDVSVVMGNFAPPFYMFCNRCHHKWHLINNDSLKFNIEKRTQRTRSLGILLFTQIVPWLILLIILVVYALNLKKI